MKTSSLRRTEPLELGSLVTGSPEAFVDAAYLEHTDKPWYHMTGDGVRDYSLMCCRVFDTFGHLRPNRTLEDTFVAFLIEDRRMQLSGPEQPSWEPPAPLLALFNIDELIAVEAAKEAAHEAKREAQRAAKLTRGAN
jgi:hypothetical protein